MNNFKKVVLAAVMGVVGFLTSAHASLIGQTISASGTALSPNCATIGDGVEFTAILGHLNLDFDSDTLTVSTQGPIGDGTTLALTCSVALQAK
jgi:hypothetical protein